MLNSHVDGVDIAARFQNKKEPEFDDYVLQDEGASLVRIILILQHPLSSYPVLSVNRVCTSPLCLCGLPRCSGRRGTSSWS